MSYMSMLTRLVRTASVAAVFMTVASSGVAVAAPAAPAAPAAIPAGLPAALDEIHAAGVPGAFAEVRDGGAVWRGASGVADLTTGRPVHPWFRQRAGSITKTFVSTTLLQLVGERRLGLDDPIGRWLPDLVPTQVGRQVTVRMLLNHTSGIGDFATAIFRSFSDVARLRAATFTPRQLAQIGLALPPTNGPGAAWSYSNTNYILAGLILERVTGRDAATEITRRIIRPLGLANTYFPGDNPVIRGPHSSAYVGPLGAEDFSAYNMSWAWMAGALVSTTADLDRFFRALLGGRLLRAAQQAQLQTTVPIDPSSPDGRGYGLGIYWINTPCGKIWGHDGVVWGQSTISLHSPDGRRQVTLALNLSHYAVPGQPNPIDTAVGTFLLTALCGASVATPSSMGLSGLQTPWKLDRLAPSITGQPR
jgi:D-alanyl-D-alanine carboxypeptidase